MQKSKWLLALAALIVLVFAAGCGKVPAISTQGLVVNVIDIGQGDAILIRVGGQTTLVDTGDVPARERLVAFLKNQGVTVIDNLIITHPHSDHIGGAEAVFGNFSVKRVYDGGATTTTAIYRNYLSTIKKKNIAYEKVAAPSQLDIGGGAVLKIFGPDKTPFAGTESDLNNNSVVSKLVYGEFAMLLTGDAEKEAEGKILSSYGSELKSAVLKAGHHGSSTSSTEAFLKAVNPAAVIISVGANNEYHHPHPSTIKKYNNMQLKVFKTSTDGTVTVTSDGKTYNISKEK